MIEAVERALNDGRRVYWVCPLVAKSESIDLAAAEDRYEALKKRFGDLVALVDGQMRGGEKDRAMARFAEGAARILVATTVSKSASTCLRRASWSSSTPNVSD